MRPDPPRMSRWKLIGIPAAIALLIVVIPTAIGAINPRVFATPTPVVRAPVISTGAQPSREVRYTVTVDTGGGDADVTYRNAQGGSEQVTKAPADWEYDFTAMPGAFLYVSGQNTGSGGGVTCTITIDGNVWKTSHSTGGFTIATCSGILGG